MAEVINFKRELRRCTNLRNEMARSNAPRGMSSSSDLFTPVDDSIHKHENSKFIYRSGGMHYANMDYLNGKVREKWKSSIAKAREVLAKNRKRNETEV